VLTLSHGLGVPRRVTSFPGQSGWKFTWFQDNFQLNLFYEEVTIFMPDCLSAELKSLLERIDVKIRKISALGCLEIGLARVLEASFCLSAEDLKSADEAVEKLRSKISLAGKEVIL
jgi:hypothetical protein